MVEIKSIKQGTYWYRTGKDYPYSRIEEILKPVSMGRGQQWEITVYRLFDHEGNLAAEIEADQGLTIIYKSMKQNL